MIMEPNHELSFTVGQEAEAKSFEKGYRSAWFRCKVKSKLSRGGQTFEYFDFPDEKEAWAKLYQKPKHLGSRKGSKMELMVRPSYPPCYRESQLPDSYPVSEVVVIVNDTWKVGDLVDWWYADCYWSAKIIELLGNDEVQVKLPDPPLGEGQSYPALCKSLRPSLDWSPKNGWTVPLSGESGNLWHCARLIQPNRQDEETENLHSELDITTGSERNDVSKGMKLGDSIDEKSDAPNLLAEIPPTEKGCSSGIDEISQQEKGCSSDIDEISQHSDRKTNGLSTGLGRSTNKKRDRFSKESDSQGAKDSPGSHAKMPSGRYQHPMDIQKKTHIHCSSTIEESIMNLEEVANKIRWMKGILSHGYQWSNSMKPSWRLVDNNGTSSKVDTQGTRERGNQIESITHDLKPDS